MSKSVSKITSKDGKHTIEMDYNGHLKLDGENLYLDAEPIWKDVAIIGACQAYSPWNPCTLEEEDVAKILEYFTQEELLDLFTYGQVFPYVEIGEDYEEFITYETKGNALHKARLFLAGQAEKSVHDVMIGELTEGAVIAMHTAKEFAHLWA